MRSTAVVVGAGLGGARTAQALRREGFTGRILLVGDEKEMPYDRPPLSKAVLAGEQEPGSNLLLSNSDAAAADIDVVLGVRVDVIDHVGRNIMFEDGSWLEYDVAVIATGAAARPSPWRTESGIHLLRTAADARALRKALREGGAVVVIGGGFIGAEVAAAARKFGLEVTIVDPVEVPMSRVLSTEVGEYFLDLHRRNGVHTKLGVGVTSVTGSAGQLVVNLNDGTQLSAASVVVGIGSVPNTAWLANSGLPTEDGIECDEHGRVVGADGLYAVGDVAMWYQPRQGRATRVEHWTNAIEQAAVVARNIVHPDELRSHDPVQFIWSDQYDWKIQVAGYTAGATAHELIGQPGVDRRFAAVYTRDGESLYGVVAVNWPQVTLYCRRGLAAGISYAEAIEKILTL